MVDEVGSTEPLLPPIINICEFLFQEHDVQNDVFVKQTLL